MMPPRRLDTASEILSNEQTKTRSLTLSHPEDLTVPTRISDVHQLELRLSSASIQREFAEAQVHPVQIINS